MYQLCLALSPPMGIRAKSPPPRSSAAKAFAQDRSLSPFKKSENAVASPSSGANKSQLDSAYTGVQDKFWLLAFLASFVVCFGLEATGVLTVAEGSWRAQFLLNHSENFTFFYVKYMFNNHVRTLAAVLALPVTFTAYLFRLHVMSSLALTRVLQLPPYLCAVLVMAGVLALFFLVVKFFARHLPPCRVYHTSPPPTMLSPPLPQANCHVCLHRHSYRLLCRQRLCGV